MTQQNQPTLLAQAQLTDAEILEELRSHGVGDDKHHELIADFIANAATRKAFETIVAWMGEYNDREFKPDTDCHAAIAEVAQELERELATKEAHDA